MQPLEPGIAYEPGAHAVHVVAPAADHEPAQHAPQPLHASQLASQWLSQLVEQLESQPWSHDDVWKLPSQFSSQSPTHPPSQSLSHSRSQPAPT